MRPRWVVAGMAIAAMIVACGALWVTRESGPASDPPPVVQPDAAGLFGVFEGRVPCTGCERIKVRLTLSSEGPEPTSYRLELIHVGLGDERDVSEGTWTIELDDDPARDATYVLDGAAPDGFRHYLAVGDDILLFLEEDGGLVVGDASHSFTLSRTG